jgi:hypothetical protein
VPAAAVIPAPIAYIKVVVVKKLVVEPRAWLAGPPHRVSLVRPGLSSCGTSGPSLGTAGKQDIYFEKIRVLQAGLRSNTLAWNNKIGRAVLFCWFTDGRND